MNIPPPGRAGGEEKSFLKKLVGDLLLMADTFTQILGEAENPSALRAVAVWLRKETRKLRSRSMAALSKYNSAFNLLAKTVLEIRRALAAATLEAAHGPRRDELVRLKLHNDQLRGRVAELQARLRDEALAARPDPAAPSASASTVKFEDSEHWWGAASSVSRLVANPELLSPEQSALFFKSKRAPPSHAQTCCCRPAPTSPWATSSAAPSSPFSSTSSAPARHPASTAPPASETKRKSKSKSKSYRKS